VFVILCLDFYFLIVDFVEYSIKSRRITIIDWNGLVFMHVVYNSSCFELSRVKDRFVIGLKMKEN
jgi:hypothetical protein